MINYRETILYTHYKKEKVSVIHWIRNKQIHRTDGPAIQRMYACNEWNIVSKRYHNNGQNLTCSDNIRYIVEEWYQRGVLHREDGPAIKYADGSWKYYYRGKFHRNDGPAIKNANGTWKYYRRGKLHRDNDLPACKYTTGYAWYQNGVLHRDNGKPAELYMDHSAYYRHGRLHRDNDLPAIIIYSRFSDVYQKTIRNYNISSLEPFLYQYEILESIERNTKYWYQNGQLHRNNKLPAIIHRNGKKEYYTLGKKQYMMSIPAMLTCAVM